MRGSVRDNGLGLFFGLIFLLALVGQALTGHAEYDNQQLSQGVDPVSLGRHLRSSDFATDVTENWQSEFLAVGSFAVLAVDLRRRGSPDSEPVGAAQDDTGVEG